MLSEILWAYGSECVLNFISLLCSGRNIKRLVIYSFAEIYSSVSDWKRWESVYKCVCMRVHIMCKFYYCLCIYILLCYWYGLYLFLTELSEILNEAEGDAPPALPPRTGGGSSSRGSTPTPTMAIPRPPSRKALEVVDSCFYICDRTAFVSFLKCNS